jgi:hypothetical protein
MEVHAHSHTARKKWTHYFWEFLMLFLAVFCGFLAEYQLEHKIEKEREKQFIASLVNDLAADTVHLNTIIRNREAKTIRLDSLRFLLNSPDFRQRGNDIYFNAIHTGRRVDIRFTPNDGALQQMKNAGGLRLIRKRNVIDLITKYDVSTRSLLSLGDYEAEVVDDYRHSAYKIFNSSVYDSMMNEENVATRPVNNPALLPFTTDNLNEMNFSIYTIKLINKGIRRDAMRLLQEARVLIDALKKEYHL